MNKMRGIIEQPQGFLYKPDFLTEQSELQLLELFDELEYKQVVMRGQASRRVVHHFGLKYDYDTRTAQPGEPMPPLLDALRTKTEAATGLAEGAIAQALVTKYPVGSSIGWHRDSPVFGVVVGISLKGYCVIRLQRGKGEYRRVFEQLVEPRSAYVLQGEARHKWEHHIPALKEERYSITFRTMSQVGTVLKNNS